MNRDGAVVGVEAGQDRDQSLVGNGLAADHRGATAAEHLGVVAGALPRPLPALVEGFHIHCGYRGGIVKEDDSKVGVDAHSVGWNISAI